MPRWTYVLFVILGLAIGMAPGLGLIAGVAIYWESRKGNEGSIWAKPLGLGALVSGITVTIVILIGKIIMTS